MSDTAEIKRGPGRPPRAQETQARRRRRDDMGDDRLLKLSVPEGLKEKGFVYRWLNDTNNRLHAKTKQDDWDVVNETIDPTKDNGEGTAVRRPVGTKQDGSPLFAYLVRKPEDYYREDKAKEQEQIKEQEDALKRGVVKGAEALSGPQAYVPGGRNQISHGS